MRRIETTQNGQAVVQLYFPEGETPIKPAFGDPCNRCGVCCLASQCCVSTARFGKVAICPALELDGNGKYTCGLMVNAEKYVPSRVSMFGKATMELYMKIIMGDGSCSCKANGEIASDAAIAREKAYDDSLSKSDMAFAFMMWMT